MARTPNSRWLRIGWVGLALVAIVNFAIAARDLSIGGFNITVFGLRLSSWEVYKPLTYGIVSALLAFWIRDSTVDPDRMSWARLPFWSGWLTAAVAIASVTAAIEWNAFVAGGPDGYGYASQALLWASGRVVAEDPFARLAPVLGAGVAPIGYRLAETPGSIVPTYPPGLPLMMAGAVAIGGERAMYLVPSLLGGAAVWLTYLLGTRLADRRTALFAATLFACSPLFFFHALVPMSDVPATAWWLLMLVLTMEGGVGSALGAGASASVALLIRPNLVPIAVAILAFIWVHADGKRALAFAAGMLPLTLMLAAIHQHLYGSPIRTGYGDVSESFSTRFFLTNIRQYSVWLVDMHSPAVLLAGFAPLTGRLKAPAMVLVFSTALLTCYLFYQPFEGWIFLRFLLPAIPLLLVLCAITIVDVIERVPLPFRGGLAFAACAVSACWFIATANRVGAFDLQRGERRYLTIAQAVERSLPSNAVLLSVIHSGNVRMYGHRATLRWDMIDPDKLDGTLEALRDHEYEPYVLLEPWEEARFRERFSTQSALGRLDWPPRIEFVGHIIVHVYAPADRERHLAGESVPPQMIPGP
jgi:hypothetical protein